MYATVRYLTQSNVYNLQISNSIQCIQWSDIQLNPMYTTFRYLTQSNVYDGQISNSMHTTDTTKLYSLRNCIQAVWKQKHWPI